MFWGFLGSSRGVVGGLAENVVFGCFLVFGGGLYAPDSLSYDYKPLEPCFCLLLMFSWVCVPDSLYFDYKPLGLSIPSGKACFSPFYGVFTGLSVIMCLF